MSEINTDYFSRCIATLERAFNGLQGLPVDNVFYDIYRAACVKEFELILEQAGKLLKKRLHSSFADHEQVVKKAPRAVAARIALFSVYSPSRFCLTV
ncbi:MAG: hypothetical protein ACKN9W_08490, partial [Methylococcus sp.]